MSLGPNNTKIRFFSKFSKNPMSAASFTSKSPNLAPNMGNIISRELLVIWTWFTPHFNQNVHITVVNFNIGASFLKFWVKNSHFNEKWLKWLKGGQKHKIGHIEDNNEVRVPKRHQYIIQVDRRQTTQDKNHCYLLVWLYGMKNVKNGTKIKLKGGQKKIGHIEDNNEVRVP